MGTTAGVLYSSVVRSVSGGVGGRWVTAWVHTSPTTGYFSLSRPSLPAVEQLDLLCVVTGALHAAFAKGGGLVADVGYVYSATSKGGPGLLYIIMYICRILSIIIVQQIVPI